MGYELRKGRDVIGLPVISLATGKELGVVEDLIWSHEELKITHLVVNAKGFLNRTWYIPLEEVKGIGDDAVTVDGEEILEKGECQPEGKRVNEIAGGVVVTEEGRNLGTLEDVFFDGPGRLLGYEVSTGLVGDLLSGRMIMPPEMVVTWGKEAVIASYTGLDGGEEDRAVSDLSEQTNG
jgi:uncharacterized protein YrrD